MGSISAELVLSWFPSWRKKRAVRDSAAHVLQPCGEPGVLNGGTEEQRLSTGMHKIDGNATRKAGLIRNCYATELESHGGC